MNKKIIVSDPGDEMKHIYDGDSKKNIEETIPVVEDTQEEAIVDPSYLNAYD